MSRIRAADVDSADLVALTDGLELPRLSPGGSAAGACRVSLPWPRAAVPALALGSQPASAIRLGQWPDWDGPRRLLLSAPSEGSVTPAALTLTHALATEVRSDIPDADRTTVSTVRIAASTDEEFAWSQDALRVEFAGRSLDLVLGLRRSSGELVWWQACRLIRSSRDGETVTYEMGGVIPFRPTTLADHKHYTGFVNPYLHLHYWLNGRVYLHCHAGGVVEVVAHHINSRFVDDGADLIGATPVIGLRASGPSPTLPTRWAGDPESARIVLGDARLDLTEAARLATATRPGAWTSFDDFAVWQAYAGAEIFGGACSEQRLGDPFLLRAEQSIFSRGLARTVRFSFSLSDRDPYVAIYGAPPWWYGLCEELMPQSILPVLAEPSAVGAALGWIEHHTRRGGFEDGAVGRRPDWQWTDTDGSTRYEPGWEGEVPHAQFLTAWRTSDGRAHAAAIRSAYHFADVAFDHVSKLGRMHGNPPHAVSLPMTRLQGALAGYLETGDPYLREIALNGVAAAHAVHQNSWPRLAVGRDACYVRSAVLAYRYFGEQTYARIAREALDAVVAVQRDNGSFGDQGGGAGIHQFASHVTKPWMGLLALGGMLDYLEAIPRSPEVSRYAECVQRFADWLLAERWQHNGALGWSYQHDYDGQRRYFDPYNGTPVDLPTADSWHHDTLARLLGFVSLATGDPRYATAWQDSFSAAQDRAIESDHEAAATLQFLPWLATKLWNARWCKGEMTVNPQFTDVMHGPVVVSTPNGVAEF